MRAITATVGGGETSYYGDWTSSVISANDFPRILAQTCDQMSSFVFN